MVLIPESFTLACETEIVKLSGAQGIFGLKIFSPSSLVREIRELTGYGDRKPVSGDGQNMIVSRVLHHLRDELVYYRDSVAQPTLAARIAGQIDDFTRARLTPEFLRQYTPASRRTGLKLEDVARVWEEYRAILGRGFEDTVGQWMTAVARIRQSGLLRDSQLLIWGFDYITHDILNLVREAALAGGEGTAEEVVIGLISDDIGPDRDIFRSANDSVKALAYMLHRMNAPYTVERTDRERETDAGIAFAEKHIYALGAFGSERVYTDRRGTHVIRENPAAAREEALKELETSFVPDMSHVRTYYARNSYLECQHTCRTLIRWRREGVAWEEMAVAVCEQDTLPSLLPLTLAACGIPFNAKQDRPILMSGYAQYFLSLLRILRLNFCREDVIRMIKTGFTPLQGRQVSDMENYARENGIHRGRWLKPFREEAGELEELRRQLVEPICELRTRLKGCSGKQAAALLFEFITEAGVYERLLAQEEELAGRGDDEGIDRNRQVWTAVNDLLDTAAGFIGDERLELRDLCAMLEASLASRKIKSLPQLSGAVTVAPPQMFFSSGIRRMIVMGLQENEISAEAGVLSEHERTRLEAFIEDENRKYFLEEGGADSAAARPYSKIGQSLADLAARQKQDVYQAVSLAQEELVVSCSGAKPSGGVMTPSAAFTRLSEILREVNPENVTGSLMDADLPPFAPAFALEALAVRMREAGNSGEPFLPGEGKEDAAWRNALGSMYRDPAWKKKVEAVLRGLHIAPPSASISPEQARKLYITHGMTISRVETFSGCPYRHFLQYGLGIVPTGTYGFKRNEAGTFNHDVLKMFLDRAMRLPEWPDLSEETLSRLLDRVLKERAAQWEGGILTSDTLHRYQGAGIIRGVRTSVGSMMRAFRMKPHFLPAAAEVPFGTPDSRIPAVRIRAEDGTDVAFSGRIDRIDTLETADGKKYFLIIDNKMSSRDLRENSVNAGLQLQLPLYIRAAREGLRGFEPAGGLYQPVKDVLVGSEDPEETGRLIDKELQTSGMILDDEEIRAAARPVKISNRQGANDTISAVSAGEIAETERLAAEVITDRVNRIRRGEVSPQPVADGQVSPCSWCEYADACMWDANIPGCRVREIRHERK